MVFPLGHVAEVFDEVHDVGAVVHGILHGPGALISSLDNYDRYGGRLDLHTRSSCSRMHECRSSSMSLYLRA